MGRFKNYQIFLKEGEPFVEIIQKAKKDSADLIVKGTHGEGQVWIMFSLGARLRR